MTSDDDWEGGSNAGSLDVEEALEWWGVEEEPHLAFAADDGPLAVSNMCVRCGREEMLAADVAAAHGVLFCCELAGRACEAQGDFLQRSAFLQCCAVCGESRVLAVDFGALGLDFRCGLAGLACTGGHLPDGAGAAAAEEDAWEDAGTAGPPLVVQRCSLCSTGFASHLDLASIGIDFHCSLVGRACWQAEEIRRTTGEESELKGGGPAEQKAAVLSLVEQQRLLAKIGQAPAKHGSFRQQLERGEFKQSMSRQVKDVRERFRDGQVVCFKGERFITVGNKASPGPGSELGGVIGSSARGRLGLGLRKMTKEEAEKYALSNKERGHFKKRVAHAKNEREIVQFETKRNMHQLTHAAILPASAVR